MEELPNSQYINAADLDIDYILNYTPQGLLGNIMHDCVKIDALRRFNDTYQLMPMVEFKKLIESSPFLFKKVFQRDFKGNIALSGDFGYRQELMFFSYDGILLYVEVAEDGKVDQARAWMQVDFKNAKLYTLYGNSAKLIKNWVAEVEVSADEAFIYKLIKYDLCADILPKWIRFNTPAILTLDELDSIEYDDEPIGIAKVLINDKLSKLPDDVRRNILFKENNE